MPGMSIVVVSVNPFVILSSFSGCARVTMPYDRPISWWLTSSASKPTARGLVKRVPAGTMSLQCITV